MILTEPLIRAGMKAGRGLTKAQAMALNLEYPLRRGWVQSLVGTAVSDSVYAHFLSLKGVKKGKRRKKGRKNLQAEPVEAPAKRWNSRAAYLRSAEWRETREVVLDYYGGKCEHCESRDNLMVMRREFFVQLWDATIDQLKVACRRCVDNFRNGLDPVEGRGALDREYAAIVSTDTSCPFEAD